MLVSLNELKKLVDIKIPDADLLKLIGSRLVEVEGVTDLTPRYKKIYAVKVLECKDIEGTHLHLCKIDAGVSLNAEVDPEHKDYVQVVCGAPNVKADMFAAWIAPGAIVPASFGTSEPFEISARPLRGFTSYGMLAAADELALGSDHEGIIELAPDLAAPGTPLSSALDLNDKILEIENKSLTHRPDCFGLIGFAREVAGILGQPFSEPKLYQTLPSLPADSDSAPTIQIASPSLCPCYSYAVVDLKNPLEKSPYFDATALFLAKAGMHTISKIVDVTNVYMLMTGQPLHAFDYDKFLAVSGSKTPKIGVRLARPDEVLTLLDGKTVSLTDQDILITSADVPVALAGAMGGDSTKIDASTKKVILESATFSLYHLRKTQMSHGIFSEAITRFTKGQPAGNCAPVLAAAARDLGGKLETTKIRYAAPLASEQIRLSVKEINSLLGSSYSPELIKSTLENVGFTVLLSADATSATISAPFWRTDIHIKEDIIEEVGRLLGYDNLPLGFPSRPFICASVEPLFALKTKLRAVLSDRLGMNEVLTYSFVSQNLQSKVNELNQVTKKSLGLNDEGVPVMETHLGLTTFGDFYTAKSALAELEKSLRLSFSLESVESAAYFEPVRSAAVFLVTESGKKVSLGLIGELKKSVLKAFKLEKSPLAALELNLAPLALEKPRDKFGIKLSRFPFVSRDLTFRVPAEASYKTVEQGIIAALAAEPELVYTLKPVSIYQPPRAALKNLSFHLEIAHAEKTLAAPEISAIIEEITNHLSKLGAEVV